MWWRTGLYQSCQKFWKLIWPIKMNRTIKGIWLKCCTPGVQWNEYCFDQLLTVKNSQLKHRSAWPAWKWWSILQPEQQCNTVKNKTEVKCFCCTRHQVRPYSGKQPESRRGWGVDSRVSNRQVACWMKAFFLHFKSLIWAMHWLKLT